MIITVSGKAVTVTITSAQKDNGALVIIVSKDVRMMLTALMTGGIAAKKQVNARNA
jgi:uncharacterized membrane protein YvbJ